MAKVRKSQWSKVFQVENDLRDWVKEEFAGRVYRIQAAAGGDHGLPDCLIISGAQLVPVELKVATIKLPKVAWKVPMIPNPLRPTQRAITRQLLSHGLCPVLLVGRKFTADVWVGAIAAAAIGADQIEVEPFIKDVWLP